MDLPIHIEQTNLASRLGFAAGPGYANRGRLLLRRAAAENALIHAFHFPFPGVGYVRAAGDGWRFEPLE